MPRASATPRTSEPDPNPDPLALALALALTLTLALALALTLTLTLTLTLALPLTRKFDRLSATYGGVGREQLGGGAAVLQGGSPL